MQKDVIIIGQGICGTMLSWFLKKEGLDVIVIDDMKAGSSSRVASGVINPVTGKRVVKTWMIDELLPFAINSYKGLEATLDTNLISQCSILDIFARREEESIFRERVDEVPEYLQMADSSLHSDYFNFNYSIGAINPAYLIDMHTLLDGWRTRLKQDDALLEGTFSMEDCKIEQGKVSYKDIKASHIIFCDGVAGYENPYFSMLPFSRNKGEVLIVSIPGLPREQVYKQGIKIVPWKDDLFWVGSSFQWKFDDVLPTEAFKKQVEAYLNGWLKLPYSIVDHRAAERPTTVEYKPFVGLHPKQREVGIFNGMGTKGCSLAPYFAAQLAQHLANGAAIMPEVDIKRFARILSR